MLLLMVLNASKQLTNNIFILETNIPLSDGTDSSESALEFVSNMGAGWNLGNSFCCYDGKSYGEKSVAYYETLWGNPVITKTTIDAVKEKGFKTVRIPITYRNHIDANNQIDEEWLSRIKEVVDYVIEDDMYCIINLHHENWLIADVDKQAVGEEKLEVVWKQIAEYFSEYGNNLIFEGFNEVINSAGKWDSADYASYSVVNHYNQTFVDAVRSTGGNNSDRYLIVKPYAAKATKSVLRGFVLPTDVVNDRLIVSTHIYDGINSANEKINYLYNSFICDGIPVIIGEWGMVNNSTNTEQKRIEYSTQFLQTASKYGIPCLWWDDGGLFKTSSAVTNFCIYKRNTQTWYFDDLVNSIIQEGNPIPFELLKYKIDSDPFEMRNILNWKSGDYHYATGKYTANDNRICMIEEKDVIPGVRYFANISDPSYHILVRIIDSNGNFIKSYNLYNRDSFCYDTEGYKARISIYNSVNGTICKSFDDYKELFQHGFEATLKSIVEYEENVEEDVEENVEEDVEENVEEDIVEEPIDIWGMSEFVNWKSGEYYYKNGNYVSNASRICLNDYKNVKADECFVAQISDEKYKILIRYLDESGKLINSSSVSNGEEIIIPDQTVTIGISLYNTCNSKLVFDDYKELFENGFEAKIIRKKEVLDTFGMKDVSAWKSGEYNYKNGIYTANDSRICLNDYVEVLPNQTYSVNISDHNYKMLARFLDENDVLIDSIIYTNGNIIVIPDGTKKMGISIYNPNKSRLTFENYLELFEAEFCVYLGEI